MIGIGIFVGGIALCTCAIVAAIRGKNNKSESRYEEPILDQGNINEPICNGISKYR